MPLIDPIMAFNAFNTSLAQIPAFFEHQLFIDEALKNGVSEQCFEYPMVVSREKDSVIYI